ncbi:MAG: RIP metalloprotease RseP [Bacteroidales bacterium]|nr:RIP metalloprotease RseP [Bacteroidales bacterium]
MFDSTFWFKALELILSLSILVFIHELGHFMWARIFKVGVDKFYLFFDAYDFALVRWNKKGLHLCELIHFPTLVNPSSTEYGIGWIPLGGYCAIVGMIDETHDAEHADTDRPDAFVKKGPFARFMILFGGVLNNLLLAIIIYIGMAWHWGKDILEIRNLPYGMEYNEVAHNVGFQDDDVIIRLDGNDVSDMMSLQSGLLLANDVTVLRQGAEVTITLPDTLGTHFLTYKDIASFVTIRQPMVVDSVMPGTEAARIGLLPGDSIVSVDSIPTPYIAGVHAQFSAHHGDTILLSYYRGDSLHTTQAFMGEQGKLGFYFRNMITPQMFTHIDYSFAEAIPAGITRGWDMLYNYVRQFKLVFTKEGAKELGGFGSMGAIFPEEWIWKAFWGLTAFISVALAFMNILPIPMLDGGHILILLIETIMRRPLSDKFKDRLQYIGFGFIVLLMIAVNANDIIKFFF